jgi:hypothetical protein
MMIDALGTLDPSFGLSNRDLLGLSCSDSDADEETDEVGEVAPPDNTGLG